MSVVDGEIAESVRVAFDGAATRARPAITVDALHVAEGLSAYYGQVIRERLVLQADLLGNQIANVSLVDVVKVLDQLYSASQLVLVDGIGIEQSQNFQRAVAIIEKLGLSEALQGAAQYNLTLSQGLRLTTSLASFFGVEVLDELGMNEDLLARTLAFAHLDDGVGIEAAVNPQLLLNVVLDEAIDITPEMALRMLWSPTLVEGVELSAGMLEPNGAFTTWVMNTRTGAVTEYADFVFNSFAALGNRYIAASEDGLFELLGDDDDGDDIIARVKGGYLQFGGTQLSRLKEAYIAQDGEQRMVLRIRTKDGTIYNYDVDTRDGRSTKVHMGKGQRSRYFAFELVSEGQDFTLDTLEFVPIVVQRRV